MSQTDHVSAIEQMLLDLIDMVNTSNSNLAQVRHDLAQLKKEFLEFEVEHTDSVTRIEHNMNVVINRQKDSA